MPRKKIEVTRELLLEAVTSSQSLLRAANSLGLTYNTFKRRCQESDIELKSNQGLKGGTRRLHRAKREYDDIKCKYSIKLKMLEDGTPNECQLCKLPPEWNGSKLVLQLDHIDGDRTNNRRSNLRLLCPNCHSQTDTWGVKNARHVKNKAGVAELVDAQGSEPCGP